MQLIQKRGQVGGVEMETERPVQWDVKSDKGFVHFEEACQQETDPRIDLHHVWGNDDDIAAILSDPANFFHSRGVIAKVLDNFRQYHAIIVPRFIGESSQNVNTRVYSNGIRAIGIFCIIGSLHCVAFVLKALRDLSPAAAHFEDPMSRRDKLFHEFADCSPSYQSVF
jgi:hypothetical protein